MQLSFSPFFGVEKRRPDEVDPDQAAAVSETDEGADIRRHAD
jgi:hypothetical protein